MKLEIKFVYFLKNTKISNSFKVRPVQAKLLHADRQTYAKFIVTFRNFKKAPKILLLCEESSCLDESDVSNNHTGCFFLSSLFNRGIGQRTCAFFDICSDTMRSNFIYYSIQTKLTIK